MVLLERALWKVRSVVSRYFIGHILFRIHSRIRFADSQRVRARELYLSERYIEGGVYQTKTSERSKPRAGRFLVGARIGLRAPLWRALGRTGAARRGPRGGDRRGRWPRRPGRSG